MMISEDAINSNNVAAKLLSSASEYERRGLKAEKLERLRDEFAMAVITGIYSNPNRAGTCIDALKQAYELASQVHHVREIKNC